MSTTPNEPSSAASAAAPVKRSRSPTPPREAHDEASMKDLIRAQTEAMKQLSSQLTQLDTKFTTKFSELDTKVTELQANVAELGKNYKVSIGGSVQLAARHITRNGILSSADEGANEKGDVATWTLVTLNGEVYAVGCAHCAFFYKTLDGERSFVSLPEQLVGKATGVLFFKTLLQPDQSCHKRVHDFVAVRLKAEEFPLEGLYEWTVDVDMENVTGAIVGHANACDVLGDHLFKYSGSDADHFGALGFVQQQGEPGNSGTLMHAFKDDTSTPLGVFWGIAPASAGMRPRGVICPFPPLSHLESADCVNVPEPMDMIVMDSKGQRQLHFDGQKLQDGDVYYPGVLIDRKVQFMGSHWVGACRAR